MLDQENNNIFIVENRGGEPQVSSLMIASETFNNHRSIIRMIRSYFGKLSLFGKVGFEITPSGNTNQNQKVYYLNEDQATFFLTLLRNNEIVVDFKFRLVKAFVKMKKIIAQENKSLLPGNYIEALEQLLEKAKQIEKQQKLIEFQTAKIERDKTKLDFLQDVFRSRDTITLQEAAKAIDLEMGQNRLFRFLRDHGIFMKNNQPYQKYVDQGYFRMVAEKYNRGSKPAVYMKTVVLPKGLEFIYRKIKEFKREVA